VILLARTAGQLEESQVLLRERGVPAGRISVVPADLSDEVDRGCAAVAVLEAGRVDILVNNAATVEPRGPTIAIPAGEPRLAFEVNVAAPAALAAAVLPGMLDARWGRVVNVSSAIAAYLAGVVGGNAYATTPRRPCSPTWPATTPGPSATLASPRCGPERQANAAGGGRVPRATGSGRGLRVYLTAMTSTGLMEGSLASSSSAALPSASASGPAMCAWRPFSLAKVSKIP
jgi:hypothetical protein